MRHCSMLVSVRASTTSINFLRGANFIEPKIASIAQIADNLWNMPAVVVCSAVASLDTTGVGSITEENVVTEDSVVISGKLNRNKELSK